MVRGRLSGPGEDAIRAHKQGVQTPPIFGVTGDIGDPIAPAAGKGLKRCASVKSRTLAEMLAARLRTEKWRWACNVCY
jgi:hypothetical protein